MNCLPDINVWLALTFSAHPHHSASLAWFETLPDDSCAFCRMTQQGYLRLASNPKAFRSDALSLPDAWLAFDQLLADGRVAFLEETADVETHWREFTADRAFSPKIWNDAFLAAFAISSGFQLVSFDKGFRRYSGLNRKILTA